MPVTAIDYSKSCVYRLVYNYITYYVGSTTNFRRRKWQHKSSCNNEKSIEYDKPLYAFIRNNGGWCDDWSMILIETYPDCKSSQELVKNERIHYDFYKPELNSLKPFATIEERVQSQKENVAKNREKLHGYRYVKINCECGGKYLFCNIRHHEKTMKHQKYIKDKV